MIEAGLIAARFVHYAGLALLFGSWAYADFGSSDLRAARRLALLALASALLVLFGAVAVLAATVAGLGGDYSSLSDWELWWTVIKETDFGQIWSIRLGLAVLAVALAISWIARRGAWTWSAGVLVAGALVISVAWTGHAAVEEGFSGQVHRWADALHLIAAMVWAGVFVPILWMLALPSAAPEASRRLARFHAVGLAAVLTLVGTGVVNSYFLVGMPTALFTTTYGQLLTVKLILFAGMVVLAAANRLKHTPALPQSLSASAGLDETAAKLRRSIRGELVLGLLVFAVVALLGAIAPAASG